jgi:hypothetical protein
MHGWGTARRIRCGGARHSGEVLSICLVFVSPAIAPQHLSPRALTLCLSHTHRSLFHPHTRTPRVLLRRQQRAKPISAEPQMDTQIRLDRVQVAGVVHSAQNHQVHCMMTACRSRGGRALQWKSALMPSVTTPMVSQDCQCGATAWRGRRVRGASCARFDARPSSHVQIFALLPAYLLLW